MLNIAQNLDPAPIPPAFIFAVSAAGDFGLRHTLPWPKNKTDTAHFRLVTMGQVLLLGRQTAAHMPPLPGREILVLSHQEQGDFVVNNLSQAIKYAAHQKKRLLIGGGAKVLHSLSLDPRVNEAFITLIDGSYPSDTKLDLARWLLSGGWTPRLMSVGPLTEIYRCTR